jgi:hypothetical protein
MNTKPVAPVRPLVRDMKAEDISLLLPMRTTPPTISIVSPHDRQVPLKHAEGE